MQIIPSPYDDIIANDNHLFETKLVIAGVTYEEDVLFDVTTSHNVFNKQTPVVGCAVAGEIDVTMISPTVSIPKMAMLQPYVRATDGEQYSEWIPKGTYFIDTRDVTHNSNGLDVLTIHGYDSMLKLEKDYPSDSVHNYPILDYEMVEHLAVSIGMVIDARTYERMDKGYRFPLPLGYSGREMLGFIAASYAGNFVITDENKLLLIRLQDLPPETNYLITESGDAILFGGDRIKV